MKSRLWLAVALALAGCAGASVEASTTTSSDPTTSTSTHPTTTTSSTFQPSTTTTVTGPLLTTYLVWTSGGMTEGLTSGLLESFDAVTIVTGDAAALDVGGGQVVPLDAIGLDSGTYGVFDPAGATDDLRAGAVLLGETSASFRGLAVGDTMSFGGVDFEVAGIAPDDAVGAAEVVFSQDDPGSPVSTDRYALVRTDMSRGEFVATVESLNDAPVPPRVMAQGETPFLRHADGVLPQIFIKLALGEFSYPAASGSTLEQDAEWVSESIVTAEVPILGTITCHRVVVDMATGAFNQLLDEGLADLIDPAGFAGCWNPRFIRTVTGTPTGVSRHSWGAALDINAPSNQLGTDGDQDPRLVEIMEEWGFGWGGDWTVSDPMHFEYEVWPGS